MMDRREAKDMRLAKLALEAIDNAEAAEPMLKIEATEPIDPMLKTDPREPIDNTESVEAIDHLEPRESRSPSRIAISHPAQIADGSNGVFDQECRAGGATEISEGGHQHLRRPLGQNQVRHHRRTDAINEWWT